MQKKPQHKAVFHLFVPNLLKPLNSWYQDFLFEVEAPHLSELLKKTLVLKTNARQSLDRAFFQTFYPETSELPIAYYRHQVQLKQIRNNLICADPVHFEVGMNDVTLTHKITDLTNDEAKEIIELLNSHFVEDGLEFIFGSNQNWYVSVPENETINSHDLDSVLFQNIMDKLVQSENRNWQVIQNETQMLLHSFDINQQREMAGLETVNSLWFWGAGKPTSTKVEVESIYYNNETSSKLRGELFAKALNCKALTIPKTVSQLVDQTYQKKINQKTTRQIFLLDQLFIPALENKLEDFQQQLEQIDNQIIKPLLQAWYKNEIDIVIDCCNGTVLKPQRTPAWKFWLKPKKLREICS